MGGEEEEDRRHCKERGGDWKGEYERRRRESWRRAEAEILVMLLAAMELRAIVAMESPAI